MSSLNPNFHIKFLKVHFCDYLCHICSHIILSFNMLFLAFFGKKEVLLGIYLLYNFFWSSQLFSTSFHLSSSLFPSFYFSKDLQTYLRETWGSVPDHHKKASITAKWIKLFFGFPVHIKIMFTLYYSLFSVQ